MSSGTWGVIGAVVTVVGVIASAFFTARGSRQAAAVTAAAQHAVAIAQAAPTTKQVDLQVMQATVQRVDEENRDNRARISKLEALVRAFAWTADRWRGQMSRAGVDPEPPHPLVDDYYRTGV